MLMVRAIDSLGSGGRRLGFGEAEAFPPGRTIEPDLAALNLFDPVAFDHVPFGIDVVVDNGELAAGLPPDALEPPMAHRRDQDRRRRAGLGRGPQKERVSLRSLQPLG